MPPETNPEPQGSQPVVSQPTPVTPTPMAMPQPGPTKSPKFGFLKGKKKLLLTIVVALLVILGGAAAAYYTVVVPNKPENKLLDALINLSEQKQVKIKSKIDFNDKKATDGVSGFVMDFLVSSDADKKLMGMNGSFGVGGAQFPFEIRVVDENIYLKVGGLGSIDKLLPPGSGYDEYLQTIAALNDQWFVIDRSFLQQMDQSNSCSSSLTFDLSDDDRNKIESAYKKYPLLKVKSTSSEQVDGVDTTKMELEPTDNETLNKFMDELNSVGPISKLKKCLESAGVDTGGDQEIKPANITYKAHAFVTNDKQLKRLTIDAEDDDQKMSMTFDFSNQIDSVTKPEGAKPIQDLLGSLLGDMYGDSLPYGDELFQ